METLKSGAKTPPITEQQRRQRKFYLMMPLLVLPFLTLAFWALGGGHGSTPAKTYPKGLDATLPQAQFKTREAQSKMAVYQEDKHPAGSASGISPAFLSSLGIAGNDTAEAGKTEGNSGMTPTAAEQSAKIEAKLAQLNRHLQEPAVLSGTTGAEEQRNAQKVRKLNQMARLSGNAAPDPEMQQLSQLLKQIQAIQNPESVRETKAANQPEHPFKAIPAIIDGDQKIRDGAAVKLKLTDSVNLKHVLLPAGHPLYGTSQVVNQRLLVRIKNIRAGEQIIPVDMVLFSLDGMEGIPAPEAEFGETAGSGASNALQNMQFLSMDQSLGGQAAASGVNAAKGLFSKKVKKIRVKVKDELKVLLKINH